MERGKEAQENTRHALMAADLPHHRAIVALDIEQSTRRPDPVKAELRRTMYDLFEMALRSAGIEPCHRDPFIDRGDGLLALIRPVHQAPKAIVLNQAIPALSSLLADHNAGLPRASQTQRMLRIRAVVHAGEVAYDDNGCFGEALDVAFRLLDADRVKRMLRSTRDPLILVVSEDIYRSVVRHGFDGIDREAFRPLVRVQVGDSRHCGWVQLPAPAAPPPVAELASYRAAGHLRPVGTALPG